MSEHTRWDELADAALTHDRARELSIWRDRLCLDCGRETVIPGEHACAECFIAAAKRRQDQERPPVYQRWFGPVPS